MSKHWKTALNNYTVAHKYDQKAYRCLGLVMFEIQVDGKTILDMYWQFVEQFWEQDDQIENLLVKNFPFRKTKTKRMDVRYMK